MHALRLARDAADEVAVCAPLAAVDQEQAARAQPRAERLALGLPARLKASVAAQDGGGAGEEPVGVERRLSGLVDDVDARHDLELEEEAPHGGRAEVP